MEDVKQRDIDSHCNRFIVGEPQVQPRDTVVGDEWSKRYKTPLVEKISFRCGGSRQIVVIRCRHVDPVRVVDRATSERLRRRSWRDFIGVVHQAVPDLSRVDQMKRLLVDSPVEEAQTGSQDNRENDQPQFVGQVPRH